MKDLISIVVPIYNVKEYLDACIKSIINQTYKNIEIILVDDGSTDGCADLCDEYKKFDSRIRVIHKENGGLSDARNTGLEVANGVYIVFIDSDDYVNVNMVKELYDTIIKTNSDISICKFKRVKSEIIDIYENKENKSLEILSGKKVIEEVYGGNGEEISFVAWNKMYKKDLFYDKEIRYPKGRIYEDTFTTYKLLYYSKAIAIIDKYLYYYRVREGSIINTNITKGRCIDAIDSGTSAVSDFEQWNEKKLMSIAFKYACRSAILEYNKVLHMDNLEDRKYCKKYIIDCYRRDWKQYATKCKLPLDKKLVFGVFYLFSDLMIKLKNMVRV